MKIIVVISGFTQQNYENTGSKNLWRKLRMERDFSKNNTDVIIELKEWDTDWKEYAKYINSLEPSEVFICCYSWGAGYGMPQLAKRLECEVRAVVCDPVKRSMTWFGRWFAFLDMKIHVPKNVSVLGWLSQRGDWLDGDKLVGGKSICYERILDYKHTEIDDSKDYHKLATELAVEYLNK